MAAHEALSTPKVESIHDLARFISTFEQHVKSDPYHWWHSSKKTRVSELVSGPFAEEQYSLSTAVEILGIPWRNIPASIQEILMYSYPSAQLDGDRSMDLKIGTKNINLTFKGPHVQSSLTSQIDSYGEYDINSPRLQLTDSHDDYANHFRDNRFYSSGFWQFRMRPFGYEAKTKKIASQFQRNEPVSLADRLLVQEDYTKYAYCSPEELQDLADLLTTHEDRAFLLYRSTPYIKFADRFGDLSNRKPLTLDDSGHLRF